MAGLDSETKSAGPWSQFQNAQPNPVEGPWSRFNSSAAAHPSRADSGVKIPESMVSSVSRLRDAGYTEILAQVGDEDGLISRNPSTGELSYLSPGRSVSDQDIIKEMLGDRDMSANRREDARVTLGMNPAQRRGGAAANFLAGVPYFGSYTDEAAGSLTDFFGGDGETATDRTRQMRSMYETAYPGRALTAKIGGGITGSVAALAAAPEALVSGATARFAALPWAQKLGVGFGAGGLFGASEGAVSGYGAGGEEGGPTREESSKRGALWGGAIGAPLNAVAPSAVSGIRSGYNLARNTFGAKNQTDAAADIILDTMQRSGDDRTLQQLASEVRENPAAGLIGADTPVPSLSPTVASKTALDSQASQTMREAQDVYVAGTRDRISNQVRDTLSVPQRVTPEQMSSGIAQRTQDRFQKQFENFDDVPLTDDTRTLLRSSEQAGLAGEMGRVSTARATLDGEVPPSQFYPEFLSPTSSSRFGDIDIVTPPSTVSGLLREGEQLRNSGRLSPNQGDYLNELEPSLEGLVPGLGAARREYGAGMRASEAVSEGRAAVSGTADPFTVRSQYSGLERSGDPRLNRTGRMAYRLGMAGNLENTAMQSNPGQELARRLDQGTLRDVMKEAGTTGPRVQTLRDYANRESQGLSNLQAATPSRVGGGLDSQDVADAARRGAYMQMAGAVTAGITDMISKGSDRVLSGLTTEGRRELARITTSTSPTEVMDILERRLSTRDRMKVIDALIGAGITAAGLFTTGEMVER